MAALTAHPSLLETLIPATDLASAIGAGSEFALLIAPSSVPLVAWQTIFTGGNPASITVTLEASEDGTNWAAVDTSTNVDGEVRVVQGAYRFIRANNSAVTGGTGVSLLVYFTYAQQRVTVNATIPLALKSWTKVLTHAQILTLPTVPVILAPADVGIVRIPLYMGAVLSAGTAYTNLGSTNLSLTNGSDGRLMGACTSSTFFGATTANTFLWVGYGTSSLFLAVGPFVPNSTQNPLYLEVSGSSNFTGGDANRTLTCTLWTVEFPYLFNKGRL